MGTYFQACFNAEVYVGGGWVGDLDRPSSPNRQELDKRWAQRGGGGIRRVLYCCTGGGWISLARWPWRGPYHHHLGPNIDWCITLVVTVTVTVIWYKECFGIECHMRDFLEVTIIKVYYCVLWCALWKIIGTGRSTCSFCQFLTKGHIYIISISKTF